MINKIGQELETKNGFWNIYGLSIPVNVLADRTVYNRHDVLIVPIGGQGQRWVESNRVVIVD